MSEGFIFGWENIVRGGRPDPDLDVSQWADTYMVIPAETGAAEPGRYRSERTPFAREVMHCLSPKSRFRRVVVKGASQLLKTQVGLNWFCSLIHLAPANMIWMQPTDNLAKRVSARFDKTVEAVDQIKTLVAKKASRSARNTMNIKEFKGGTLWILSGGSAANLAEMPARYVYADEVDRIIRELKGEGDPVSLLEKRQGTFGTKAKSYFTSSPTEVGASRIDELYQQGDQRKLYVPCPHCLEMQTLEWEQMTWDLAAGRAEYVCVNGCIIEEYHKTGMLNNSEWRAQAAGDGETASFEISYLYAPLGWASWLAMAKEYEEAKVAEREGNLEKMQVFFNTRLARCWSAVSARIKPQELRNRAEPYKRGVAPMACRVLTAAVDVQNNRLECLVAGWGPGETRADCWFIDWRVFYGDPTVEEVWNELDEYLKAPVYSQHRTWMPISMVAIDSGNGNSTHEVYEFVRKRRYRMLEGGSKQRVIAIKGASAQGRSIITNKPSKVEYSYQGKPRYGSVEVWSVGTDTCKDWVLNRLTCKERIIHTSSEFDIEFYEQLLSEARVTRWTNGRRKNRYEMVSRQVRNECLDMAVYNLAASWLVGLHHWSDQQWAKADLGRPLKEGEVPLEATKVERKEPPRPTIAAKPYRLPKKRSAAVSGFGRSDWSL